MKDLSIFIAAALESIELIQSYTQDAVIRNLEIIGQAIKDFGIETLLKNQPNIAWREIAGMRNVLADEYLGVNIEMVWNTVQIHLDDLQQALETILK
ncbi:MAG: DUF86 domain-containing protein [Methylococcaceae bacterium]|nr:DUF86 domain-containing protein [Methylococcaceae bacterium]